MPFGQNPGAGQKPPARPEPPARNRSPERSGQPEHRERGLGRVARVGFHALDGARFLAARGYGTRVAALVAHHSGAAIEAELRGVVGLGRFRDEQTATRDALGYCDAVTGPQGQQWSPDERWAEIRRRHGPDDAVTTSLDRAEPALHAAVDRTSARMAAAELAPLPHVVANQYCSCIVRY